MKHLPAVTEICDTMQTIKRAWSIYFVSDLACMLPISMLAIVCVYLCLILYGLEYAVMIYFLNISFNSPEGGETMQAIKRACSIHFIYVLFWRSALSIVKLATSPSILGLTRPTIGIDTILEISNSGWRAWYGFLKRGGKAQDA